jgi:phosphoesterase RecJ-like protein
VLVVVLDCGSDERLGSHKDQLLQYKTVVIDHHRTHIEFSSNSWIDPESSSTGEMIYELAQELEVKLNYEAAYNLYVAILTDTGCFRYESTTSRTMRIAGDLLDLGVKPERICNELFDNFTHERLKLMELVLSTIELRASKQIAFMHVSEDMLDQSGATIQDVEGFIDFPRSLRSVKVAALLKEKGNGCIGVSLRAKGECDVSRIARMFNGGGHRNASGFRCYGKTMKQVQQEVEEAISSCL